MMKKIIKKTYLSGKGVIKTVKTIRYEDCGRNDWPDVEGIATARSGGVRDKGRGERK